MPKPGFKVITITEVVYNRLQKYHQKRAKENPLNETKLGYKQDYRSSFSRDTTLLLDKALREEGF